MIVLPRSKCSRLVQKYPFVRRKMTKYRGRRNVRFLPNFLKSRKIDVVLVVTLILLFSPWRPTVFCPISSDLVALRFAFLRPFLRPTVASPPVETCVRPSAVRPIQVVREPSFSPSFVLSIAISCKLRRTGSSPREGVWRWRHDGPRTGFQMP